MVTESIAAPSIKADENEDAEASLAALAQASGNPAETQTPAKLQGALDAAEFTRLLTSRRQRDLKVLARKLSVPLKVKI